jgi:hypothetical protein
MSNIDRRIPQWLRSDLRHPDAHTRVRSALSRREFLGLGAAASAYPLLAGCGGGGGTAAAVDPQADFFTARNVVVKPNVVVLPEDGSVTVNGLTDTGLTLSGTPPAVQPGQVIVSGQGAGLMRRVTAVTASGTSLALTTQDAGFADVFKSANISYRQSMNAADIESMQIGLDGVQIGAASRSRDVSDSLHILIPKTSVSAKDGDTKLAIEVAADFNLGVAATGNIVVSAANGLELLELGMAAVYNGTHSLNVTASVPVVDKVIAYGRPITFKPIRLGSAGPVPIVLVNILFTQMSFKGNIIGGWETTASGTASGAVAMRLTSPVSLSNLTVSSSHAATGDFKLANFFASFEFEAALWELELQSTIDFVLGPKFLVDLPSFKAKLKSNLGAVPGVSEASEDVEIDALFKGSVSLKAGALGLALPESKLTLAEAKVPLFGPRNFKAGSGEVGVK